MALQWFANLRRPARPSIKTNARRPCLKVERLEDRLTPALSVTDLTQGLTPTDLVQALVGTGVQVFNIKFTGANVAGGKFTGGQGIIGFDQGIILSSGGASGVIGPNNSSSFTVSNGTAGDSDLDAIVAPNPTLDAAVLEFDFVPASGTLSFKYVFSSEEYPEFVNSPFNDVFAFFLNGKNIALIPNTSTPVSINNAWCPSFWIWSTTYWASIPLVSKVAITRMVLLFMILSHDRRSGFLRRPRKPFRLQSSDGTGCCSLADRQYRLKDRGILQPYLGNFLSFYEESPFLFHCHGNRVPTAMTVCPSRTAETVELHPP